MAKEQLYLFRRRNGIWYIIRNTEGRTKWKSTGCRNKSDALRFLKEHSSRTDPTDASSKSLNEFLVEFLKYAKELYGKKTFEIYRRTSEHLQCVCPNKALNGVTGKVWDDYAMKRTSQIAGVSLAMEQRTLKSMFNRAVAWGLLLKSPFAPSKVVRPPERPPKYFTREEFDQILSTVKEQWIRNAIVLSVSTGLRRGELVNLKWAQIDLARSLITIHSDGAFLVKAGKTRTIPLSRTAQEALLLQAAISRNEYVFSRRGRKITGNYLGGRFRGYVKQAGLWGKGLHWHNLRSSFASWLVADGASIYAVSKILGHSSVTLTQRHYAGLAPESLHATVNMINIDFRKN